MTSAPIPAFYEQEALRYYANIVASFSRPVLKAIDKLSRRAGVGDGPLARAGLAANPGEIVELYRQWAGYATGLAEPGVTLCTVRCTATPRA
jgi:anaerobic nitric oxide reductase flavorubredoxin